MSINNLNGGGLLLRRRMMMQKIGSEITLVWDGANFQQSFLLYPDRTDIRSSVRPGIDAIGFNDTFPSNQESVERKGRTTYFKDGNHPDGTFLIPLLKLPRYIAYTNFGEVNFPVSHIARFFIQGGSTSTFAWAWKSLRLQSEQLRHIYDLTALFESIGSVVGIDEAWLAVRCQYGHIVGSDDYQGLQNYLNSLP